MLIQCFRNFAWPSLGALLVPGCAFPSLFIAAAEQRAGISSPAQTCGEARRWLALDGTQGRSGTAGSVMAAAAPSIELDISLDPTTREFKAQALLSPETRDVRFVLHESLQILGVTADGRPLRADRLAVERSLVQWRIRLPDIVQSVAVSYAGKLPPLERSRDHRSVLGKLPPMASPDGSFLPAGSAWYPQPLSPFSYRLTLSVPADQRALVPGRLVAETLPIGPTDRYRASFEFSQPTDGIDLMAGPWLVREKLVPRQWGWPLRLRTYFPAALDAAPGLAEAYLDDSARFIERYGDEIGAYPYSEFSVVAGPLPTGFGMPTLTYIGAAVLRLPFIRKTSLGHEILHNWWGNGVYVDYARGNWSEGLTTFMADYAYKEDGSAAAAAEMRLTWLRDAAALPAEDQPALRDFRSRSHGAEAAVGYGKAAMVFLMLRDRIGHEAFRKGIREFWAQRRFRVASWQDLRLAFERASDEKLEAFFASWLDRPGLPQITIEQVTNRSVGQRHRLSVTSAQTAPPVPVRLPLEISAPGRREIRWIEISAASEVVHLEIDFRPQQLRLDPDVRVWRRLESWQLPPILRLWIGAKTPLLLNVARNSEAHAAVDLLAQRFFETPPKAIALADLPHALGAGEPILLAGTHAEVSTVLAAAGLPPRPGQIPARGSGQVWTSSADYSSRLAVISAKNAEALRAMQGALPHYGSKSWLIFEGGQVIENGVWPVQAKALAVSQDAE